jgi:ligand-binding sensor domain-containing protein
VEQHKQQINTAESANSPAISAVAQNTDEHGYEWITTADGKNWYRTQGSNDEWVEFSN